MHKISIQTLLILVMSFLLIAMLVPMSFVVQNENNEINLLYQERLGATLIPQIERINILLAQHRGTANRYLSGNPSLLSKLNELEQQISQEFIENITQCEAQSLELACEKLHTLQTDWLTLKESYSSKSSRESFTQHSSLIARLLAFLTDIADKSNLSLDSQLSTYHLMYCMVETLPNLMENIGQLRGWGSGLLTTKQNLDLTEKKEVIELLHGVRLAMRTMNFQIEKVFAFLPEFEIAQRQNLNQANQKTAVFLADIEKLIDFAPQQPRVSIDDKILFDQATEVISQIMGLYSSVVETLNQELIKRLESLRQKQLYIFSALSFLTILLISFLYYFKKRLQILNYAVTCFEQLSVENYDHAITITYHDEIGRLLKALTIMQNTLAENVLELKNSISRLTQAQRIAKLGDWQWNKQTNKLTCSQEIHHILDIPTESFECNFEQLLNQIKTSDREQVTAAIKHAQHVAGGYDIEYKTNCKNGEKKIIHQRIESYANEQGEIVRLIGTMQDVTQQREMETKLRLAAEVFDHIGEAIVVTDEKNKVILINRVFSEITGYSEQDVIGQNPHFLSSGKHDSDFYQTMWRDINATGIWKGEIWNHRKDGTLYPEILTITTMRNNDGEILNHIGIFSDITEQKQAVEKIEYLANYDALTGLMNRHALEFAMKQIIAQAKRQSTLLALLFIDLDGFKAVNDTLGHDAGDAVLKTTAENLKKIVRECDITARLGGDEFVVILTNLEDVTSIHKIADKIVLALNQQLPHETGTLFISPSIGISVYSHDCDDYEKLLSHADKAMYVAKMKGKNNYQFAP